MPTLEIIQSCGAVRQGQAHLQFIRRDVGRGLAQREDIGVQAEEALGPQRHRHARELDAQVTDPSMHQAGVGRFQSMESIRRHVRIEDRGAVITMVTRLDRGLHRRLVVLRRRRCRRRGCRRGDACIGIRIRIRIRSRRIIRSRSRRRRSSRWIGCQMMEIRKGTDVRARGELQSINRARRALLLLLLLFLFLLL